MIPSVPNPTDKSSLTRFHAEPNNASGNPNAINVIYITLNRIKDLKASLFMISHPKDNDITK